MSDPIQEFINTAADLKQQSESESTEPRLCTDKRSEQRLLDGFQELAKAVLQVVQRVENETTNDLVDLRKRVEALANDDPSSAR